MMGHETSVPAANGWVAGRFFARVPSREIHTMDGLLR